MAETVRVTGLRELAIAFRQVDSELPKKMKDRLLAIAGKIAGITSSKYPVLTGRAAGSVKPRASASGASIVFGGQAAPYAPWLDFGGSVGRHKSIHRAFIKEGRYLYPTIKAENTNIKAAVDKAIEDTVKEAGFETSGRSY